MYKRQILFCQPKDREREIWDGLRLGPDAAPVALGLDAAYTTQELDAKLPGLLDGRDAVWYPFATHKGLETRVADWLGGLKTRVRYGALAPEQQQDVYKRQVDWCFPQWPGRCGAAKLGA